MLFLAYHLCFWQQNCGRSELYSFIQKPASILAHRLQCKYTEEFSHSMGNCSVEDGRIFSAICKFLSMTLFWGLYKRELDWVWIKESWKISYYCYFWVPWAWFYSHTCRLYLQLSNSKPEYMAGIFWLIQVLKESIIKSNSTVSPEVSYLATPT